MRRQLRGLAKRLGVGVIATVLCTVSYSQSHYKVLHHFSKSDGSGPWGGVTLGPKGVLFGTTASGGSGGCNGYGCGVVFKLRRRPDGKWVEAVLHSFDSNGQDGYVPYGGVILGDNGSIYGTTWLGGAFAYGTVFELTHTPSGWQESVLHSFGTQNNDGGQPVSGLVMDDAGDLYGTTSAGGEPDHNDGTVFELTPGPGGWNETVLYTFCFMSNTCPDGVRPYAGVIWDSSGNLYGTTAAGGTGCGAEGCGVVYELSPAPGGGWKETVLYRFNGLDGVNPGWGSLLMDGAGRLYGTTTGGGGASAGVIYRLTPQPDGSWKESVLHSFKKDASGFGPNAGVVMDSAGNLYGTTDYGGFGDCGVIYTLSRSPMGKWTYTVLHTFTGPDGCLPEGNLVPDGQGNYYGATALGGAYGAGVVFKVVP